jgi:hypothetical protein
VEEGFQSVGAQGRWRAELVFGDSAPYDTDCTLKPDHRHCSR